MSFTDMMSSGRGPGVIGMLLALLVLIGFGTLFIFAFDEGFQGKGQTIEAFVAQQAKEIDSLQSGIRNGETQLAKAPERNAGAKQLKELNRENQFRRGEIDSLNKGIESAKQAVSAKNDEFEAYKDQYRAFIRGAAKGQTLESLKTLTGSVYQSVKIREVTAVGMQIIHSDGQKRIPYEELPLEMQDLYQFDAKQKADALAHEQSDRSEHEKAVNIAAEAANQQAMADKERNAKAAKDNAKRAITEKNAQIEVLKKQIRDLEEAIPKQSLKAISNAPQMRQTLAAKQRQLSALRSEVATLRSQID